MTVETTHVPSTYLAEILHLLQALSEVEERLNSPVLQAKDCEDLFKQEECLKVRWKAFLATIGFRYFGASLYWQPALILRDICFVSAQPLSVMYAYADGYIWRHIGVKFRNTVGFFIFICFTCIWKTSIRVFAKSILEWERKGGEGQLYT